MTRRYLLISLLAACTMNDPNTDVPVMPMSQAGRLAVDIMTTPSPAYPSSPAGFSIAITRSDSDPPPNGAKPADCMRVSPSLAVSVNGAPATITSDGGIDQPLDTEDNCLAAIGMISLDALPATADIALSDDTAELHIILTQNPDGTYLVGQCGAHTCSTY
jgi:hypothetical protein